MHLDSFETIMASDQILIPKILTLEFGVNFDNSLVTISIDSTGQPLYKRGWRKDGFIAPLKENLAASLIRLTEWDKKTPIIDPMCGSGTFIIEGCRDSSKTSCKFYLPKKGFSHMSCLKIFSIRQC